MIRESILIYELKGKSNDKKLKFKSNDILNDKKF